MLTNFSRHRACTYLSSQTTHLPNVTQKVTQAAAVRAEKPAMLVQSTASTTLKARRFCLGIRFFVGKGFGSGGSRKRSANCRYGMLPQRPEAPDASAPPPTNGMLATVARV
jgi:hypothetical protein